MSARYLAATGWQYSYRLIAQFPGPEVPAYVFEYKHTTEPPRARTAATANPSQHIGTKRAWAVRLNLGFG